MLDDKAEKAAKLRDEEAAKVRNAKEERKNGRKFFHSNSLVNFRAFAYSRLLVIL